MGKGAKRRRVFRRHRDAAARMGPRLEDPTLAQPAGECPKTVRRPIRNHLKNPAQNAAKTARKNFVDPIFDIDPSPN
jgi:hypothetical protein